MSSSPPSTFSSARGSIENQLTVAVNVVGKTIYTSMPHNMMQQQHSGKSYEDIIGTPLGGNKHRLEQKSGL